MTFKKYILAVFTGLLIILSTNGQLAADNETDLINTVNQKLIPLTDDASLDELLESASQNRLVLLGESTHGTNEYYHWRYIISKRLIEEFDFDFIVVEGDWPSFNIINQKVKGLNHEENSFENLFRENFNRWPQWMWANEETVTLAEWLHSYNSDKALTDKAGIYGMDVYSKQESIEEVQKYLNSFNVNEYTEKAAVLNCFEPYDFDGSNYARAISRGAPSCEDNVLRVVEFLSDKQSELERRGEREFFNAQHNALIVKNAERHFRTAVGGGADSWNHRAYHFYLTAERLLEHYGEDAKGVVWAHNTHIGDARATSMVQDGSFNIGQLARENLGRDNVFLIGFGSNEGRVLAGTRWGSPRMEMQMPQAGANTIERLFSQAAVPDFYFVIDEELKNNDIMQRHIGHRAVGVVYSPAREYPGNYVPTVMGERYDAFMFIRETKPLNPLH